MGVLRSKKNIYYLVQTLIKGYFIFKVLMKEEWCKLEVYIEFHRIQNGRRPNFMNLLPNI